MASWLVAAVRKNKAERMARLPSLGSTVLSRSSAPECAECSVAAASRISFQCMQRSGPKCRSIGCLLPVSLLDVWVRMSALGAGLQFSLPVGLAVCAG